MKCRFYNDMSVNPEAVRDSDKDKIKFRTVRRVSKQGARVTTNDARDAYFPAGTIYECQHAPQFCTNGEAEPADEECANAVGLTAEELSVLQKKRWKEEHIQIEDWPLFEAGAIEGYDPTDEDHDGYKPGPNWDKWWQDQAEDEEDE